MVFQEKLLLWSALLFSVTILHAQPTTMAGACTLCNEPLSAGEGGAIVEGINVFHCPQGSRHNFHDACLANLISAEHLNIRCPICHAPLRDEPEHLGPLSQEAFNEALATAQHTISPTPLQDEHGNNGQTATRLAAARDILEQWQQAQPDVVPVIQPELE